MLQASNVLSKHISDLSSGWDSVIQYEEEQSNRAAHLLQYQLDERPLVEAIENLTFLQFQGKSAVILGWKKKSWK